MSESIPAASRPLPAPVRGPLLAFALDVALAFALMVVTMVAAFFVWGVARGLQLAAAQPAGAAAQAVQQQIGTPPAVVLIAMTLLSMGGTALLLYAWRRPASAAERAQSHALARRSRTWAWAGAAGVATFLASSLLTWGARGIGLEPNPSNLELIKAGFAQHPVFLGLFAVVLAPLYEELLFRRVLFGRLWQAGRPWLGLALSSLVFALAHEMPGLAGNPPLTTLFLLTVYAVMGAVFAGVYRATGTLWAPIGAHVLNNALALAVMQLNGGLAP